MADYWQLEENTDQWQLEESTDLWELEESGVVTTQIIIVMAPLITPISIGGRNR